jgi:hypothetical protein
MLIVPSASKKFLSPRRLDSRTVIVYARSAMSRELAWRSISSNKNG